MATSTTFGQPTWGRWAPGPEPQQYNMMGGHQGPVYYSSPPESPDMMANQMMPHQYALTQHYGPAYHSAPAHPQAAPVPQHVAMPYAGYNSMEMSASPFPIKQEPPLSHYETASHGHIEHHFYYPPQRDVKPSLADLSPPSSRRGSNGSLVMGELRLASPAKTIKVNKTYDPNQNVTFDTPVDRLMKVLNPESSSASPLPTPEASPKFERATECASPQSMCDPTSPSAASPSAASSAANSKAKRYYCDGPDCNASFQQKVHLKTHQATHTGEKPHKCPYCPVTMSQAGNMNTHVNNHLGHKRFHCKFCSRAFVAKGNCTAHERNVHGNKPKIPCQLDQCNKQISTIGNLKTHTNKYHSKTIEELTARFERYDADGYIPPEERSLRDYYNMIFENSNKGVKGRGKGRKVLKVNNPEPRKAYKPSESSERRQQTHRNINGVAQPKVTTVAAHIADRQRYYGI